jgi:hypothetical protein
MDRRIFFDPVDFFINRLLVLDLQSCCCSWLFLLFDSLFRDKTFKTAIQNSCRILGPPSSNDVTTRISLRPSQQPTPRDDDNNNNNWQPNVQRPSVSSDTLAMNVSGYTHTKSSTHLGLLCLSPSDDDGHDLWLIQRRHTQRGLPPNSLLIYSPSFLL